MDRSLDDVIQDRQRNSRPSRDRRPPRDGVRKSYNRNDSRNMNSDWVHDRYDEDSDSRPTRESRPSRLTRRDPIRDPYAIPCDKQHVADEPFSSLGSKLKVENIHWDLSEDDLKELFSRIGEVRSVQLVYDRQDRSTGVAYVVYPDPRDARTAIQEFDGANANGQPIRLSQVPNGPNKPRNPFDNVERPARSLFDRVDESERRRRAGDASEDDYSSRRSNTNRPPPEHIDRYVPGEGGEPSRRRSPRRDGRGRATRGGRGDARRPGQRRDRDQRDGEGHVIVQGRPRKTAEELDAEMSDYWGQKQDATEQNGEQNGSAKVNPVDGDIDMDI